MYLKKNQSTPRPSEHPPVMREKMIVFYVVIEILHFTAENYSPILVQVQIVYSATNATYLRMMPSR